MNKIIEEYIKTTNIMIDKEMELSKLKLNAGAPSKHTALCLQGTVSMCLCGANRVISDGRPF